LGSRGCRRVWFVPLTWFCLPQFLRQIRVARSVCVKVKNVNLDAVLHFHLAEIMQMWSPTPILLKVLRHTLREQDVPAVATIHDPLRNVNADSRSVSAIIQVRDCTHWTAMHAHAHGQLGKPLQLPADFQRALDWLLRAIVENQGHAIPGWD